MKAIITGATSMIGLSLVNELLTHNVEMLLLVRDTPKVNNIPKSDLIKIKYCNIDEYDSINNEENESYDVFYHLAWKGTIGEDRENLYVQNDNVRCSLDAVNLAHRFNCNTFIGAGSQAEVGKTECVLTNEVRENPVM